MKLKDLIRVTLLFSACFLFFSSLTLAQKGRKKADNETHEWRYEVETVGIGTKGTYQLKVWTYSKNAETAIEQAKKNAVHAVIFKGFPANGRIEGQNALARDPNIESEKGNYFKEFFEDGGKFQKYVFLANNGAIGPGDRIKISKKEYKIGVVVSVNSAGLRKELEEAEVIKALNSGF
jgi:hypothetical protein